MSPFHLIGNLYFVGTYKASSHMIVTEKGLILIDTGYAETADVIVESVKKLGFDIGDVKYILHSHGHGDHTGGTAKLLELCDAKTFLAEEDLHYIENLGFKPDFYLHDGDRIKLGETEIECVFTPGHTEGAFSFFFNVCENGKTYRAGMFGGAGTNQLKKDYLAKRDLPLALRRLFFDSLERLSSEKVDVMVANHVWHNHEDEKAELAEAAAKEGRIIENPFIAPEEFGAFLEKSKKKLWEIIEDESREKFVTYAHRGASEYCPENTILSFCTGIYMGANGVETDIRRTKDGKLVLFHDKTLERVTGEAGGVGDYTYDELCAITVKKNELYDRIPLFEDFLRLFSFRDLTFAIELKEPGTECEVIDLLEKYGMRKKTTVTSFKFDCIKKVKEYAPDWRVGYLKKDVCDEDIEALLAIGGDEICPEGKDVTPEKVARWHRNGLNVRAWGIYSEETMKNVYDSQADGMTVNYPDKLIEYIKSK